MEIKAFLLESQNTIFGISNNSFKKSLSQFFVMVVLSNRGKRENKTFSADPLTMKSGATSIILLAKVEDPYNMIFL